VDIRSLAVLPLANLSGDPAQDYFADGMTDVLITELSRVKSLKVISRTSSMRFKGSKLSLPEIAKALGVEGVIEGSVTRSGGKVRVNAQLIRAASDEHLWADLFERKEEDVLALHREIAQAIAGRVQVALSSDEAGHLKQARKVNPEAFDLVLQGRYLLGHIGNPNDLPRVIRLFEKALTMDPESVEAHAGLANALSAWAAWGFGDYWDLFPRIEKEVDAALALDPNHSWALLAKADLRYAKGDAKGSAELCRRASERDPGNALALSLVGWHLDTQEGDPRGEELQKKALELDPLSQGLRCNYMTTLYCKRKFPEAEAQARKILDLDPTWFYAHDTLRRLHLRAGRLSEAQEASRKAWKPVFGDSFNPPPGLSWPVYDRWLEQFLLKQPRTFIPIWLADIHLYRGDRAKALAYLEEAAKANKVVASMAFGYPDWDPIRDDPRFQVLVEKQGLPVTLYCRTPGK
jgi:TolB-like protein